MEKLPYITKFVINPCLNQIRKVSDYMLVKKRNMFSVDQIEWQCATYAFETRYFRQYAQIVISGQKYLTRNVIRLSMEPENEIKHYVNTECPRMTTV